MNIDHFFSIGQNHVRSGTPCEDYALSSTPSANFAYGVISDGCGGATGNSDIGARAMCYAVAKCLTARQTVQEGQWFRDGFLDELVAAFKDNQYSDNEADYFATTVALASSENVASIFIFGDGAFITKKRDGTYRVTWLEYRDNTPLYLNTLVDPDRMARFKGDLGSEMDGLVRENWTIFQVDADNKVELLDEASRAVPFEEFRNGFVRNFDIAAEGIEALAVLSDGITSFTNAEVQDAAHEVMAFKNFEGDFVKRRMIKALQALAKDNRVPKDDVAISCVYYGGRDVE